MTLGDRARARAGARARSRYPLTKLIMAGGEEDRISLIEEQNKLTSGGSLRSQ